MTNPLQRLRILSVTLIAPMIVAIAALAVTFNVASTSRGRVAVHWNVAGIADGYGSPFTYPVVIAAVCLPLTAIFGGAVVLASHRGPLTIMTKLLGVTGLWLSISLAIGLGGSLIEQEGLSSPASASILALPIGFAVATVLSAGAWFVLPKAQKATRGGGTVVEPVALGAGERASWIRSTSTSRSLLWWFVGLCAVITGVSLFAILQTGGQFWAISFVPLIVLLVVLSNFAWTVRVDARGVRIRSTLGVPWITVPLANIESADVTEVQALAQYGGWGIRWGMNGRLGVIVRSGEALEILRRKGLSIVVTVDDAASAAALINGLVQREGAKLP